MSRVWASLLAQVQPEIDIPFTLPDATALPSPPPVRLWLCPFMRMRIDESSKQTSKFTNLATTLGLRINWIIGTVTRQETCRAMFGLGWGTIRNPSRRGKQGSDSKATNYTAPLHSASPDKGA